MSEGGEAYTDPSTMHGRDWPCLRQFCVFMENRVGRLHNLMRRLERDDLRIIALSIDDAGPTLTSLANDILTECYGPRFSVAPEQMARSPRSGTVRVAAQR